jgi:MFS family permease
LLGALADVKIAFMICGANSDLFGRRWFLIMGNVLLLAGHLMCGLAKNGTTMVAGFAIIGFGAGNAQVHLPSLNTLHHAN